MAAYDSKNINGAGLSTLCSLIKGALDEKQDTLTAGTNITIEDNVISATGTGETIYISDEANSQMSGEDNFVASPKAVADAVESKQDTLIAGDNITIENNVISATGGGSSDDTYYIDVTIIYDPNRNNPNPFYLSPDYALTAADVSHIQADVNKVKIRAKYMTLGHYPQRTLYFRPVYDPNNYWLYFICDELPVYSLSGGYQYFESRLLLFTSSEVATGNTFYLQDADSATMDLAGYTHKPDVYASEEDTHSIFPKVWSIARVSYTGQEDALVTTRALNNAFSQSDGKSRLLPWISSSTSGEYHYLINLDGFVNWTKGIPPFSTPTTPQDGEIYTLQVRIEYTGPYSYKAVYEWVKQE